VPRPDGQLAQALGPYIWRRGVDAGTPVPAMSADDVADALNLDLDRGGRAIPRPGSTFQSRVGWGPILGMHEHTFEVGARRPRPVAIVQDAFPTVHALNDPNPEIPSLDEDDEIVYEDSPEPSPAFDTGFVPDWTRHGERILAFAARSTDRFRFQSFLNRLYFAGSTLDHRVRWYDYEIPFFGMLEEVRGVAIAAHGNRLFVGGDPLAPNVLYPSEPNEPDIFPPQLGMQIGTRNDGIRVLLEHQGLLVILKEGSAHWLLAGAIELGDFQTEPISRVHGVEGALAACEAGDGWVYWLSGAEGPVRWRRGAGGVDTTFARDALALFQAVMKGSMRTAVVEDDPANGCVRFLIPTAGCETPNWMASYYYRLPEGGRWTHAASTMEPERALKLRDTADKMHVRLGGPLYTALAHMPDRLLGGHAMFGGAEHGSIYFWKRYSIDFRRGYGDACAADFICVLRPGPLEAAPLGHRALIHRCMIDFHGGYNWLFDVRAELDYRDTFELLQVLEHETPGGVADELILDEELEGRPLDRIHHPMHYRLPAWEKGLGKVVRFDMRWRPEWPVVLTGIEPEVTLAAEIVERKQHPPIPFPPQEEHCAPFGCPDPGEIDFPLFT
jgi:hypothetical protein